MKRKATYTLRTLVGLALLLALTAVAASAQQEVAKTDVAKTDAKTPAATKSADAKTPSTASPAKKQEEEPTYTVVSSVEFGYRGLRVDGDLDKYQSDLNYKAGPRLFDSSFLLKSNREGATLFDSILMTTTGWGADPYGHTRVSAENSKWFRFDGQYRRLRFYNYLNNFANPTAIGVVSGNVVTRQPAATGRHNYDTRQGLGDFDLTILPKNERMRFTVGFSPETYNGTTFTTYHAGRGEFWFPTDADSRARDLRLGADWKLAGINFSFLQGFRRFDDFSKIDWAGSQSSYLALPGAANVATLTSFSRTQPVRGENNYTRFSAHTLVARKLDLTGRVIYSNAKTNFTFTEQLAGLNWGGLPAPTYSTPNVLNSGTLNYVGGSHRPTTVGDFGATFLATDKLRFSNTFRVENWQLSAGDSYTAAFNLSKTNGTALPPLIANSGLSDYRLFKFRKYTDTVEGDYQINSRYSFHLGYKYGLRRESLFESGYALGSASQPTAPAATVNESEENHTHAFIGGFRMRPVNAWTLYFDAERGTADNIFTRIGEYNYTNVRARTRIAPSRRLAINLAFISRDNSNPSVVDGVSLSDFAVSNKSRVFTSSVDWTASEKVEFSGGYNYNWVNSDAVINYTYGIPPATIPANGSITGHTLYFVRNNYFFFDTVVRPVPRLSFYAAYRVNRDTGQGDRVADPAAGLVVTSYPMTFQSPEARMTWRFNKRMDWNFGYAYYNYNESDLPAWVGIGRPQNYHAHQPYVSVRFYFGNRDQ